MLGAVYTGETLWPGMLGHAFILLSFLTTLLAAFAYYKDTSSPNQGWKTIGRAGFYSHVLFLFSLIGTIFLLMGSKMYEYRYVWEHVSDDLPIEYILSAFWEGQEGSFLLWMFWHAVLGFFLIRKKYKIESHVMVIFMLVQAFIASMLLGIYVGFGDYLYKIGSNPLLLLRETMEAPLFSDPEYLSKIEGRGLNPLLQNYWNIIHPPTLFLGFASGTIPFVFAVAGLWKKEPKEWIEPVMNWSMFAACILGTGILMGGAWAYVALSFGGYWAWDPVENMSLVPWLVLIAGVHTNLIAKATGRAIKSTYLMYALSFVLLLYSTFLTRSGVLGETSAHAFTEMGLEWQLVGFVTFFALLSIWTFLRYRKSIPVKKEEESSYSREFWMYIGSIVLLFSGVIIAASTSLPVVNLIGSYFNPDYVGKVIEDPIPHYNKYQIWIACFISILSSVALWMRYKGFGWSKVKNKFIIANIALFGLSGLITYLMTFWIDFFENRYIILNVMAVYAMLTNVFLMFPNNWKNLKSLAAAASHFGFGMMVLGTITSGLNTSTITSNPFAMRGLLNDEDLGKVVSLIKGKPMYSNGYWLTYESDTIIDRMRYFDINFRQVDEDDNTIDEFNVQPNVLFSNDLKKIAASNPDTKHYLWKDIFTHVASLPKTQQDVELAKAAEDSLKYVDHLVSIGDTLHLKNSVLTLKSLNFNPKNNNYQKQPHDLGVELVMDFDPIENDSISATLDTANIYRARAALGVDENLIFSYPHTIDDLGVKVKLKDEFFEMLFTADQEVIYESFKLAPGTSFEYRGFKYTFATFNKAPEHPNYKREDEDIAIGGVIKITKDGEAIGEVEPIYVIRGNFPFTIKEYLPRQGMHVRLSNIDPISGSFTFDVGFDNRDDVLIPLKVAQSVPRTDIIILEAKVFPGINFFWLGSILMVMGFAISMIARKRSMA